MIINTNFAALNTLTSLAANEKATQSSLAKLSSGLRINSAADDAAGLSISEKMRGQISGLNQASSNAQDGISLVSTAEGALNETTSILQRMRELAVQAGNDTNTTTDRAAMQTEVDQLVSAINDISDDTQFNTKNLLDGSLAGAAGTSVGAYDTTGSVIANLTAGKMTAANALTTSTTGTTLGTDTITVDGQKIDVNWDTLLTTDQKSLIQSDLSAAEAGTLSSIKDTLVSAINTAIDNSGTGVAHISGYLSTNAVVLQSGTTGTSSEVSLTTAASATSIGALLLSDTSGAVSAAANVGESKYSGTALAGTETMNMTIAGQNIEVTAPAVTVDEDMATVANDLQTAINTGIASANATAGKVDGDDGFIEDVTITVTKDGRLEIVSPTAAATFTDNEGSTTASDLGLTKGKTQEGSGNGLAFQVGANEGQTLSVSIDDMSSTALGVSSLDLTSATTAGEAVTTIDAAIATVSAQRSELGAVQNRLEHTINNLTTSSQNITTAEANIRDVDMAAEMTEFQKNNILQQAAQAMLAQANQQGSGVLKLLQ